ncbi:Putative basic-leucine zipper domain-containing protein [Septoria linicola]|uniref:Basic-leucine zipper domain-containing protein n=1 Tax=Septoria linicola TaxID=215465 RepID=A0A9Q9ALH5_9PEZI|nr:putative basic-leucine zipper domain-containing protein [Septoria linicola]USW48298.1 Putative basic-leucine zipper domain-containing protein [Septoria linicola]
MSERRREQQPSDSLIASGNDSSQRSQNQPAPPAPEQHSQRTTFGTPSTSSPALQRHSANNGRSMELPPLPQAVPASIGGYHPASRSVGVSSILNPVDSEDSLHTRRRKVSQVNSPRSSSNVLPPLGTTNRPSASAANTPTSPSMNFTNAYGQDRPPRRILTPRSPSIHRTASLNQLHTTSAQHAPFAVSPRNRTYSVEPGTANVPPLPHLPPAVRHASYGFHAPTPPPPPPPAYATRRTSSGAPPHTRPPSESTSPRSSYSSHNEPSPAATYGQSSMPTLSASCSAGTEFGTHHDQRSLGVPVSSSGGQNVYQMMTLETTSGTVSLPVDVQAASRVADEKRRRNAGASARFRQRRKEKEKEASTTIGRLEQQLKDLGEDMEFYKRERDYMAGVILQVPGGDRHFPRPQSPRHRRTSAYSGPSGPSSYMHYQEPGARSPDSGRNVRRRTSTLSLPHFPAQGQTTHSAPGSGIPQSYPPPNYGQTIAPQPHHAFQGPPGPQPSPLVRGTLPTLPTAPQGPHQLMQASPQTGPYNPYAERRGPVPHSQSGAPPPPQSRDSR